MTVIKRDNTREPFEKQKVKLAVTKAFIDVDGEATAYAKDKAREIANYIESLERDMTVEEIQDEVVNKLMASSRKDVAAKYVEYRYKRKLVRESNTTDKTILEIIEGDNDYWNSENSNKNPRLNTTIRDYMAGATSTDISRRLLLPKDVTEAHDDGRLHFHDMDYFAQHMHNCFHSKTQFYTSEGIKSFSEFHDGDTVRVIDKNGSFKTATVRCYGKQKMNEVVFTTAKRTKTVICTNNHRWLLKDGTVTTNLTIGDTLLGISGEDNSIPNSIRECEMFTLGFLIGDGCDHSNGSGYEYSQIRLCGHKTQYSNIIKSAGYDIKEVKNTNDLIATKYGLRKQKFLDSEAWNYLSENDRKWLFIGLYSADGAVNAHKLCTTDERIMDLIRKTSFCAGYYITSETIETRDTQYKKESSITAFRFSTRQPDNLCWKVKSITPYHTGTEYDAWCIEEPTTHSFILDGGMITGNCDLVNLEDMLTNNTVISEVLVEAPHSFSTACTIATQIIAQVASSQYGGQSVSLAHLAPFVDVSRKAIREEVINERTINGDDLDENKIENVVKLRLAKEISKGIQTIQYQIVTLMTTNGQAPFLTLFMYLNEAKNEQEKSDLALLIEETLNQSIQGVKNEQGVWITPAFPKIIYVLQEDNITEDSKYWYLTELSAKCSMKRLTPDYISEKIMKEMKDGNCYPVMGCRSALTVWKDENGNPKFYGRFNQGVVTLNLVDLALSSDRDIDKFWELFEERTELCHKALRCRHERLKGTLSDVAPILWQNGAIARLEKGETIDKLLYGGYSTISLGYGGLYECVKYMTGHSHSDEGIGEDFGLKVMQALNDKCKQWKEEENIDYSLYGTPLEASTHKFAKLIKKKFGEDAFVKIDGRDRNYITNSYHIPVFEEIDAFDKLRIEAKFQRLSPGGSISYIETPNMDNNIEAVLEVIKFIYENNMYAELNTKSDYCQKCGWDKEIKLIDENNQLIWECPNCGNRDTRTMDITRRTCGYKGTARNGWNQGRLGDIHDRVMHLDDIEYGGCDS